MRVSINQHERALALLAVDLGDKECDRARKSLDQLHVEILEVTGVQGRIVQLRRDLKNTAEHHYDWGFDHRRALAICLRIYRDKLKGLASGEEKLLVETASTDEKIGDIGDFLSRLGGQESLFREEDDDSEHEGPRPPRPTADGIASVRHAVEIGGAAD